ncbi:unnamed protein product [Discosporangium mesarthrocarpum]
MVNGKGLGCSYSTIRGDNLGFMEEELLRKHLPRMLSLILQNQS